MIYFETTPKKDSDVVVASDPAVENFEEIDEDELNEISCGIKRGNPFQSHYHVSCPWSPFYEHTMFKNQKITFPIKNCKDRIMKLRR